VLQWVTVSTVRFGSTMWDRHGRKLQLCWKT
jgi:hypothetical protein